MGEIESKRARARWIYRIVTMLVAARDTIASLGRL